jgi:hypothetical protein
MLKVLDFILQCIVYVWGGLFIAAGMLAWSSGAEQIIFIFFCVIAYFFHLAIPKTKSK